jgi:hypothetical protein
VNVPTLLTLTALDASGPSPLVTKLDQYPSYVSITVSSPLTAGKSAIVAVCPTGLIPADVRARLRLGHQAAAGFEITPPASGAFLPCTVSTAQSSLPAWVRAVASLFTPKLLYAAMEGGGVGGSVTEFSPFGAVDTELGFTGGGVGGSATEFLRAQPTSPTTTKISAVPSGMVNSVAPNASVGITAVPVGRASALDCSSATVGTELPASCRPSITITTANGTAFVGVPVAWEVTAGGGTIAPNAASCGTFSSTAPTTTDAAGRVSICWTLGPEYGTNYARAIPSIGGDAPPGVTFAPERRLFTATALKILSTASATGEDVVFDNTAHAGSGSCSAGALTPVLSYSSQEAPVSVGSYLLTVTCGAGSNVYETVTETVPINIAAATPSVSVTCPLSVVYDGTAQTPCTAKATAPGLSLTPTPTYSANTDIGRVTATVNLLASGNYAASSRSAEFMITPAPTTTLVSCPTSETFTGAAIEPCTSSTTGPVNGITAVIITPLVAYSNNKNAGTAGARAAFVTPAGSNYIGSDDSNTFEIAPAPTATVVWCPASVTYTGAALTPCTAEATGAGALKVSLTVTHTDNTAAGTGTGNASASYDGDANHSGSSDSETFTIDKAGSTSTVTCTASVVYNGAAQTPCTAKATGVGGLDDPLTPITYTNNTNAGTADASASYAGGANWEASSYSTTFAIAQLSATATAGSATINFGSVVPTMPCTVSGLLSADAGLVTCLTSVPAITAAGAYATTALVSPASPVNYDVSKVNGTLTVAGYLQVGCFSSPIYSVMPTTKSAQRKGSNLPVKCGLTTPQGVPVTSAHGNLVVVDGGTTGNVNGPVVFTGNDVFKYSTGGNYAYGLDTSPAWFVAGRYYYVTATWNDGSTSKGWFLLK